MHFPSSKQFIYIWLGHYFLGQYNLDIFFFTTLLVLPGFMESMYMKCHFAYGLQCEEEW